MVGVVAILRRKGLRLQARVDIAEEEVEGGESEAVFAVFGYEDVDFLGFGGGDGHGFLDLSGSKGF